MDARTAHAYKDEKREHDRTKEKKSKVDKKDDITHHKKHRALVYYKSS
jgi:hypothetical protein